ncbi:hypothetical protein J6590_036039 [Homalodisca vitripennis]|nr:hypothetical protein J6590_036039 [Homalodisca vitripennis]
MLLRQLRQKISYDNSLVLITKIVRSHTIEVFPMESLGADGQECDPRRARVKLTIADTAGSERGSWEKGENVPSLMRVYNLLRMWLSRI